MRKASTAFLAAVAFTAAAPFALAPAARATAEGAPLSDQAAAASEISGEVVAVDVEGKVLKLKPTGSGDGSGELSLAVESDALATLKDLTPGHKVVVTCREGTSGEACAVIAIKKPDTGSSN